jgi:ribosomal protein L40E
MSIDGRPCISCGAKLAPDQEYCLECGARQSARATPEWRRPLIAAAVTMALAALVLAFAYERMRDDADGDAAASHAAQGQTVKQAGASGPAGRSGSRRPVPAAQLAAGQSP